jgi:polygalacturonase
MKETKANFKDDRRSSSLKSFSRFVVAVMALIFCTNSGFTQQESGAAEKSPLVMKLESRFMAPDFIKIPQKEYRMNDYGALGDGITDNTKAIQKGIEEAAKNGGGIITFSPGTYVCGAIFLKSNMELRLDKDVVLQAIWNEELYPKLPTRIAGAEMDWPAGLVNVYEQSNVRISGPGVIDGNGKFWWKKFGAMIGPYEAKKLRWLVDYDCERVRALVVWKSSNVDLKQFTIKRSGFWSCQLTYCEGVHVDGLIVRANIEGFGPSSDGLDIDSSRDVLAENCDIDCNDDNVCLKSGKNADGLRVNRPTENVVIRNSIARSGHGMIVLGSETSGGMRNIEVYNLKGIGTSVGIRFKSARTRGGIVENASFHDIVMEGVGKCFEMNSDWMPEYSNPVMPSSFPPDQITDRMRVLTIPVVPPEKGFPEFRNITFKNIKANGRGSAFDVRGLKERPIKNFVFENVEINGAKAGSINNAENWKFMNCKFTFAD